MNAAYLHLAINHFPVVASSLGIILLVLGLVLKRNEWIKASWAVFILAALFAIPTYLSGQKAEELIEEIPGVSGPLIETHEDMAFYALISLETLGLLSLVAWIVARKRGLVPTLINLTLVVSIFTATLVGYTANLGGLIHHPEIRPGFIPAPNDNSHKDEHRN